MSSKEDGIMIILSSPSGAGKTTLTKLLSKNNNYSISVSHTTRKPRFNEIDSKRSCWSWSKDFIIKTGSKCTHKKWKNTRF